MNQNEQTNLPAKGYTAYQIACAIVYSYRDYIVKFRNSLYKFNEQYFQEFNESAFCEFIYNTQPFNQFINSRSTNFVKDIYKILRSCQLFIISDKIPFANQYVVFKDGVYYLQSGDFYQLTKSYIHVHILHPYLIPCIDVSGKKILPPGFFSTYIVNAEYAAGKNQNCPNFNNFLNEISGGDQTLIDRIWEFIGYYLTPDMSKKCFVVLQGVGDSGKSVLGKFISTLFNYDAVDSISIRDFNTKDFPKKLINKHLLISMELNSGKLGSKIVENIKSATGNDMLSDGNTRFYNQCKLLFASNYPLITRDPAEELMKRFIPIPFKYEIPKDKLNPNIIETFIPERDAVVYKAMQAYQRLRANNYEFSGCFPKNDPELFPKANPYGYAIARFLKKYCLIGDKTKRELTDTLFQVFQKSEFFLYDITLEKFGKELNAVLECVYPKKTELAHWYNGTNEKGTKKYQWGHKGIELIVTENTDIDSES
ncbi:MAG: hypothetical protein PUB37_08640 [Firmicutes bacterium]|nr:hypothetical protein [Bacillota bacterium]